MIVITGATGQLGRLVMKEVLKRVPAAEVVAAVRNPEKAADLAAAGVVVRCADYNDPAGWDAALQGAETLLLISSSEIGRRAPQHRTVIDAAVRAGVGRLVYTSLLHSDSSELGLAGEHRETEALVRASGLRYTILRNGWYTENYTAAIPVALQHGALCGCAGEGRIASAARRDYAEAAAVVLTSEGHDGRVYELAGDSAYTLGELAAEISRQSGTSVAYADMPEVDYRNLLISTGLPEVVAALLADSDSGASRGALYDDSQQLSTLIGRKTTPAAESVAAALA